MYTIPPILISYLLGAVPVGLLVARMAGVDDVRRLGSGNIGATNVWRVVGWRAAIWVFFGDIGKGVLSVFVGRYFAQHFGPGFLSYEVLLVFCGLAAVLGQVFPVYLNFRGGKGVNTALGVLVSLLPVQTLLSLAVFLIVAVATRYVSLGSVCAAVALCVVLTGQVLFEDQPPAPIYLLLGFLLAALVIFTHRHNISRLLSGTESRFSPVARGGKHRGSDGGQ